MHLRFIANNFGFIAGDSPGFLQQAGQSGPPGDDKPPGTEDTVSLAYIILEIDLTGKLQAVDARTASYNAYMQYAYQQWMASQTGQSQSGNG